ncbi:MAG: hypothetical protein A2X94_09750 [Bdellovibrionales bacterium GWB1_55_8]|nr:MAG: hypothetical protein A2X94_09750 [Bdellovibrionales bacterium GWB1_55_8]
MNHTFRPFNPDSDKNTVARFLLDTQTITGTVPADVDENWKRYLSSILLAQKRDPNYCAMMLGEDGLTVGFIDAFPLIKDSVTGFVRFDYIVPEKRKLGLGRKLLEYALAILSRAGCKRVCLDVAKTNIAAIAFYQRLGWTMTGEGNGPFLKMSREI